MAGPTIMATRRNAGRFAKFMVFSMLIFSVVARFSSVICCFDTFQVLDWFAPASSGPFLYFVQHVILDGCNYIFIGENIRMSRK